MAELNLTIALEHYDRHVPRFMEAVKPPPRLTLTVLEVGMSHPCRDGMRRHERFLQSDQFDIGRNVAVLAYDRDQPRCAVRRHPGVPAPALELD